MLILRLKELPDRTGGLIQVLLVVQVQILVKTEKHIVDVINQDHQAIDFGVAVVLLGVAVAFLDVTFC